MKQFLENLGKHKHLFFRLFLLFTAVLLAAKFIFDYDGFWSLFSSIGGSVVHVLSYILIGFIIAYILDALVCFLTDKVLKKWTKHPKFKRILCIIIAYLVFLGIMAFIIFSLVPYLTNTIKKLIAELPPLFEKSLAFYQKFQEGGLISLPDAVFTKIDDFVSEIFTSVVSYISAPKITSFLTATTSAIVNGLLGVIVSVYMLLEKSDISKVSRNVISGLFSDKTNERIADVKNKIHIIFRQYFTGKIIQALLVTLISFIAFTIAGVPYPLLFAVILGIFNMVPYIGPWASAVPIVFISLMNGFWKGIASLICVIVIQCIDNFIISPKIVGDKIGLSPLAVLVGLCVGGKLFGIPGMIIGDVMAALVKVFVYDGYIKKKIEAKKGVPNAESNDRQA